MYSIIDLCTALRNWVIVIAGNLCDITFLWNVQGQHGQTSICELLGAMER